MAVRDSHSLIHHAKVQVDEARRRSNHGNHMPPRDLVPGYTLDREIHRGGQGVVYRGTHNATQRVVAVKILRWNELADSASVERFAREIRILASLHHPHIVSLHDGGVVRDYRYFVMDFVDGVPFDEYVLKSDVSQDDMLRIFQRVCGAIQAAHLRGFVHRDLKPSNILVDAQGEPHVLDFGLAKTLRVDSDETEGFSLNTQTGLFIGSVPWAAPEQARGDASAVDARTDVYALGLILFHSLTQRFPYDTNGAPQTVLANIASRAPQRPSTFCRSISTDLDTIIMKCLSKEPARRYQSPRDLGLDIQHFRRGEAIDARGDSTWYVLTKTIKRHRAAAVILSVLLIATFAYAATLTVFYKRATSAEIRAQRRADDARDELRLAIDALAFMVGEVSDGLRETNGAGKARRKILQGAYQHLQSLAEHHSDAPELQHEIARAHSELGDVALALGRIGDAEHHFNEAHTIRQALFGTEPNNHELLSEISINLVRLGDTVKERRETVRAQAFYDRALRIDESLVKQHPDNLHYLDNLLWSYERLGWSARRQGHMREAAAFSDKQCALAARLLEQEPDSPKRLFGQFAAHDQRFRLSREQGDEEAAITHGNTAIAIGERLLVLKPNNPAYVYRIASVYIDMGHLLRQEGDIESALANVAKGLALAEPLALADPNEIAYQRLLWAGDWETVCIDENDSNSNESLTQDHLSRAANTVQRIVDTEPDSPENWHRLVATLNHLGHIECELGQSIKGFSCIESAIEAAEAALATSNESPNLLCEYAFLLRESPYPELRNLERSLEAARRAVNITNETSAGSLMELGLTLAALGDRTAAVTTLHKAEAALLPGEQLQRHRIVKLLSDLK